MRVRIPFVVNPEGRWACGGYPGCEKEPDWGFLMDQADCEASDFQKGWIEVDLPVPQSAVTAEGAATLEESA